MKKRPFGHLPSGEAVEEYTLSNANGMEIAVLTYGGIVRTLCVPDRTGTPNDIVLGFNDLATYLQGHPYFGAIVGRVAGRITGGKMNIDGTRYELVRNHGPNHLHGGTCGFDKKVWRAETVTTEDAEGVRLQYRSPDGEEGYPGNLDVSVTYLLTAANEWILRYEATTDRPTPVSLTNHAYFNLAGEACGHLDTHTIQIASDRYIPTDEDLTLSGRPAPVGPGGTDLQQPQLLRNIIPQLHLRHGEYYLFRDGKVNTPRSVAVLTESTSGRRMEVRTTEGGVQFYTSSHLGGDLCGKQGNVYAPHAACCLECEGYPDGVNQPAIEDIVLRPGQTYRQETIYAFATE